MSRVTAGVDRTAIHFVSRFPRLLWPDIWFFNCSFEEHNSFSLQCKFLKIHRPRKITESHQRMINFNWSIHLYVHTAVHHLGYTVHQISLYGSDQSQQSLFIAYCKAVQYFCYSSHQCSGMVMCQTFHSEEKETAPIFPPKQKIQNAKFSTF